MRLKFFSPAKVNLFLEVRGKRVDGYHDIRTLFERINLCDRIELSTARRGIRVQCDLKNIPTGPKNTAYRAASLLKERYGITEGVRIRIQKRIPVAAGLGGGSSNAASVLLGLNRLWKLHLPRKTLMNIASEIGSDVPFFVLERPFALGLGRGERLKPVPRPLRKIWHCLVKPSFGISTKAAYKALPAAALTGKKADVRMTLHSIQKGDSKPLSKLLTNSLEAIKNKRLTAILKLKNELVESGALASLMSGSGSCVFGIFTSRNQALKAAQKLRRVAGRQVFVASTY